jgi:hypothetical protein
MLTVSGTENGNFKSSLGLSEKKTRHVMLLISDPAGDPCSRQHIEDT